MNKALVVLSGGQDSATCLAIAKKMFTEVHAITFDYGQRHSIEIESAVSIAELFQVASHEIIGLPDGTLKGSSPLVSNNELGHYDGPEALPGGIEPTFVPGRNILFLTLAANRAVNLGIEDIYIGVCQEDFGGYPDCRQEFIASMNIALIEGLMDGRGRLTIHTPLMNVTKAEAVLMADRFMDPDFFYDVMKASHTCYEGVKGGCGECHACILRDRGFEEAGIDDPLWTVRAQRVLTEGP